MAAKLALVFVCAIVLFQLFSIQTQASTIKRRDATTPANDIDQALDSLKHGVEEFLSKVQKNEIFQNVSKVLDDFGQKVKTQGEELLQKIKDTSSSTTPKN